MSKFLKSLFLLLTAGVFTTIGWAVEEETMKIAFSGATTTSINVTETDNGVTQEAKSWSPTIGEDVVFSSEGNKGTTPFMGTQSGKSDCIVNGYLALNCQLRSAEPDNWTVKVPIMPASDITFNAIIPGLNVINGDGSAKSSKIGLTCKVSIVDGEGVAILTEQTRTFSSEDDKIPYGTSYNTESIACEQSVTLTAGETYTLIVNVGSATGYNTYAAIRDIIFTNPVTATPEEPEVEQNYIVLTNSNTAFWGANNQDKANGTGVQIKMEAAAPVGLAYSEGDYQLKTVGILEEPSNSSSATGIAIGTTITVYKDGTALGSPSNPLRAEDKKSVTIGGASYTMCTFTFANPIEVSVPNTYQFRASNEIRVKMASVGENQSAVNLLNGSNSPIFTTYAPIVELGMAFAAPAVSYATDVNAFSEKGNSGNTGSATLSGDWALTNSSVDFKTGGENAVAKSATILTPNVNIGSGRTWTLTFAPKDGESRVVDSLSMDVVMFNSEGKPQGTDTARAVTLTVTDGTTELASFSDTLTGTASTRPAATVVLNFAPTNVTQLQVTAVKASDATGDAALGCFYGISSFNVGTYEGATDVEDGRLVVVETGNVTNKNTSPVTMAGDSVWSIVSCKKLSDDSTLVMKTGGVVGDDTTIITPNINVSSSTSATEGWALRYTAPEPRKVYSVSVTIQMFNGGGNKQNADSYTRGFKMTLKNRDGRELATTGDTTLQAENGGDSRYTITLPITPTELDAIDVEVSRGTASQGASGCFYGVTAFEVMSVTQDSPETTVLVNPTEWPSDDITVGAIYVGAEATLPAAPATQGGAYDADVFRSVNANVLTNWNISAATANQTAMTFKMNASTTLVRPEVPEALRPDVTASTVYFEDAAYAGELGISYVPFTTATDVAILYADSEDELAYNSDAWWTSATDGAEATQGALGDKTPVIWLEGGKVVMTTGADAKPLTFHDETTNGTISIPSGVTLAYSVTSEPSVSSPMIPASVTVELGGALTMAGTLETLKVVGSAAKLSGVNADNGDLTVASMTAAEGATLAIAGGNVTLTNPPATLVVDLNGGNLALTASADTTATLAQLKVTKNAELTGDLSVAQLTGAAKLTSTDTLTVTGTSTFAGALNGVALVVGDNANLTLTGNSTASTIAGAGSLTVVGTAGNLSILTLTGQSEFDGELSITDYSKLQLTGVGESEAAMPAALRIGGVLELDQGAELVTITSNYPDARITIASAATIISNAIDHSANMVIESRALLDVTSGALSLNAVELPAGQDAGVVRVRETATSGVLRVQKGFPEDLSPSNFELEEQDDTLYFFVDSVNRQVGLVKVLADISKMTEVEKQSIFWVGYYWGVPIGAEIENAGVTEIFKGEYNNAYQFEYVAVYDEEDKMSVNLRYSVKFGISEIKNARIQEDKSILVDVTALVEPYAPGGKISFNRGVDVVLSAEGLGDLKTVRIEDDTTRGVTFTDVSLPVQQSGAGTYKLNVSAKTEQQQPQP